MTTTELVLRLALTAAAALVATGLYGALSQQSVVMIMMGLELVVNGLILGAGAFWWAGGAPVAASVLIVVLVTVMAVEMAMGFAVALAIYRARQVDLTDDAAELAG